MQDQPCNPSSSGMGCLTRIYWLFLGGLLLAVVLALIATRRPLFPSFWDAAYVLVLASLVGARYIDVRDFKGETAEAGTPATMADWRRYAQLVTTVGVVVWLVVRFLAPVLGR